MDRIKQNLLLALRHCNCRGCFGNVEERLRSSESRPSLEKIWRVVTGAEFIYKGIEVGSWGGQLNESVIRSHV